MLKPGDPQALNRYAYVRNNPLRYNDPSGHFTEKAIWNYLVSQYDERRARFLLHLWKSNDAWWAMLRRAEAGDVLYGQGQLYPRGGGLQTPKFSIVYQFQGKGQTVLSGIIPVGETASIPGFEDVDLEMIRRGRWNTATDQVVMAWRGIVRPGKDSSSPAELVYSRYADSLTVKPVSWGAYHISKLAVALGIIFFSPENPQWLKVTAGLVNIYAALETNIPKAFVDGMNLEEGDVHVFVGPVEFNVQPDENGGYHAEP